MYRLSGIWILWLASLVDISFAGLAKQECQEYNYCQGENFPNEVLLKDEKVNCNVVPKPIKKCCLPQEPHLVCYDIVVDGALLNYEPDTTKPWQSTGFTQLCKDLVEAVGKVPGKTATITERKGGAGAFKAYVYGYWNDVPTPNREGTYIKDLACSITN